MPLGRLKKSCGFTVMELLIVTTIITSIPTGSYLHAKKKAYEVSCQNNLRQINMFLQMFIAENGKLPSAAFYPKDSAKQEDSIAVILKRYGATKKLFVCPAAPEELKELGLTYLWNDAFNGRRPESIRNPSKQWLMIDMNSVSKDVPAPHPSGYTVLYADGHVEWTKDPPKFSPTE